MAAEEESEQLCAICQQICPTHDMVRLECQHAFHATCILQWFRSGHARNECPLCRANPRQVLSYPDVWARCTFLRRKARAKHAPAALKRAVHTIQKAEQQARAAQAAYRTFHMEQKEMLKTYHVLQRNRWRAARRVRQCKRSLGLRTFPGMELPLLKERADAYYVGL
jgi:hypothetical protein